jgi:threonine dehydratase
MNVIEPLRMPIFFMVSGMLATSAMSRPWRMSRRRTYGMAYLYILWSAIFFIVVALYIHETPVEALLNFPRRLLAGSSGYWYLYALLVYFIIAKALRRWPIWIILAIAIALNLLRSAVAQWNRDFMYSIDVGSAMTSIVTNLVFYILGVYYKEIISWVADRASWWRVVTIVALVSAYGIWRNSAPEYWEMTYLPISLAWIAAGVMAAHLLVEYEGPRRFGTFFGARTLPIFVVQFPLLMALSSYLRNNRPEYLSIPAVQVVFPLLVTLILVFAALFLYRVTQKNIGKYLFEAPRWAVGEHRTSSPHSDGKPVSSSA